MGFSSWLGRGRWGFFFRARYGALVREGGFVEGRGGGGLCVRGGWGWGLWWGGGCGCGFGGCG